MMKQCLQETRLAYLLRVAISHLREHAAEGITEYDGADCDGSCLADDLQTELDSLPNADASIAGNEGYWPKPWVHELEAGCFGSIIDANGEAVAQVQALSPRLEPDIVKRNNWRNTIARRIVDAINAEPAAPAGSCKAERSDIVNRFPGGVPENGLACPKCERTLEQREAGGKIIVECRRCHAGAIGDTLAAARVNLSRHLAK